MVRSERRESTDTHRELVHTMANVYLNLHFQDYEAAADHAVKAALDSGSQMDEDIASLCNRRAMTVKGATV